MLATHNVPQSERRTRTPGTGLKNRRENVLAPRTVGKNKVTMFQTPIHNSTKSKSVLKGGMNPLLLTRPLHDKTPFANRITLQQFKTPAPDSKGVVSKPIFLEGFDDGADNQTSPQFRRPSSTRRHSRAPRNSGGSFDTPLKDGVLWASEGSGLFLENIETKQMEEGDDDDEVEFCPANTLDLPYQPPFDFDLPDYQEVGTFLKDFDRRVEPDEACWPIISPSIENEIHELDIHLPLFDDIDDDPFACIKPKSDPLTTNNVVRSHSVRPSSQATSNVSTAVVRDTTNKRPAISGSVRRPQTTTTTRSHPAPQPKKTGPGPSRLATTSAIKPAVVSTRSYPIVPATKKSAPAQLSRIPPRQPGTSRPPTTARSVTASRDPSRSASVATRRTKMIDPIEKLSKGKLEYEEFKFAV